MEDKILVTRPSMPQFEEYVNEIKALWDSHWITNMGMYHQQLEKKFKEIFRCVRFIINGKWTYGIGTCYTGIWFSRGF